MEKIIEIIEYENESHKVDFKKAEYNLGKNAKKNEILKDFLSFANHLSDDEKYILIGVKELEDKSKEIVEIEFPTDEAKYRQFINEYIEPQINFEYNSFIYKEKRLCYFRLFNNIDRPYLIKKDCKNPVDDKTEFKYGDGFIRIGTSTKKIGRKEIEDINNSKLKYINRHNDIDIMPTIGLSDNDDVSKWNVKYIDLELKNNSNHSIELDVEISIKKSNEYEILTETDFLKEIEKKESLRKKASSLFSASFTNINSHLPNIHINTKETENVFKVERNPINSKFAITIPQNSIQTDIFFQSILVLEKTNSKIEAEVIIRSDDFKNGALKKNIVFNT